MTDLIDKQQWLNHLVSYDTWKTVLLPRLRRGLPHARTRNGNGRGISELLVAVRCEGEICIINHQPKIKELNDYLAAKVVMQGCLGDGEYCRDARERECYARLSAKFLKVTQDSIGHGFAIDSRDQLEPLFNAVQNRRPGSTEQTFYALKWVPHGLSPRNMPTGPWEKLSVELKEALRGQAVKESEESKPVIVLVAAEKTKSRNEFAIGLKRKLSSGFSIKAIELSEAAPATTFRCEISKSAAVALWVDAKLSDLDAGAIAFNVLSGRLLLLVDASDEASTERADKLSRRLGLARENVIQVQGGAVSKEDSAKAVDFLRNACTRSADLSRARREAYENWRAIKDNVEQLLQDSKVDAEIVENTVLGPIRDRTSGLLVGKMSGGDDAMKQFVGIAVPIYSKAKVIYALNTDRYSSFWTLLNNPEMHKRFLHPCRTSRLFLYSTPKSFTDNLDEQLSFQARHYAQHAVEGQPVKLFAGDLDFYEKAFGPVLADVAIILCETGEWYRFTLNEKTFAAECVTEDVAQADPVYKRLDDLHGQSLRNGRRTIQIHAERKCPDFQCLCWQDGLEADRSLSQTALELFKYNSTFGAHRVITFQNDGPSGTRIKPEYFRKIVLSAHKALEDLDENFKEKCGLDGIEYGAQLLSDDNGRMGGTHHATLVPSNAESSYILILHFRSIDGLKEFSKSENVKKIRTKLYCDILEEFRGKTTLSESEVESFAQAIWVMGNRYVTAHDYVSQHAVGDMVEYQQAKTLHGG